MTPTADPNYPPSEGAVSPENETRALRRYFARHNQQALLLSFFSLAAAVFLWGTTYIFIYWFLLFGITISRSFDLETIDQINRPDLVSAQFPLWFAGGGIVFLLLAWQFRQRVRLERLREARLYLFWVAAEFLMVIPNVTFSIWGNLMAICRLRRDEAVKAWHLLRRMNEHGGRLNLSSLRMEFEDEQMLDRVVFALQLVGLVGMRENSHGWFLCLQGKDALTMLRETSANG